MNETTQHVVWDWNGTLLDDVAACVDAINRMLVSRELATITHESYREIFQFPVQGYYRRLGFDLDNEDWDEMAKEFHRHYHETARSAGLRSETRAVLQAFRDSGLPMSILSASERGILDRMLRREQIDQFFDGVYGLSDLYAESKMDLGRELIGSLDVLPSSVLLVGDTTHDYEVARDLGCDCVLVSGGHQSEERLRASGCEVVHGLDNVVEQAVAI